MYRLTREVRFAINSTPDHQLAGKPVNGHGGFPSLTGFGHFLTLRITLAGELEPASQYLRNIRDIDSLVRAQAIGAITTAIDHREPPAITVQNLFNPLRLAWAPAKLDRLELQLSPYLSLGSQAGDFPMIRLSQKFEFSAAHRLHNPQLSEPENQQLFGKCNNPQGHGHNYEVQVTVTGQPDASGQVIDLITLENLVTRHAIDKLDHQFLNTQVPEFARTIPSVENIARIIFQWLAPVISTATRQLASITVWETPKTWCEYSE